jgi:hypothetical protein
VVLIDPNRDQVKYMVHLEFKATNNMAEYEALIFGLSAALSLGIRQLFVKGTPNLLGVCFVAEDPEERNTFSGSSQKQCRSYHL